MISELDLGVQKIGNKQLSQTLQSAGRGEETVGPFGSYGQRI